MISLLVLTIKAPVPNYPKNIFTRYQDTYLKLFEPKSRYAVNIRDKKTILALKFETPTRLTCSVKICFIAPISVKSWSLETQNSDVLESRACPKTRITEEDEGKRTVQVRNNLKPETQRSLGCRTLEIGNSNREFLFNEKKLMLGERKDKFSLHQTKMDSTL